PPPQGGLRDLRHRPAEPRLARRDGHHGARPAEGQGQEQARRDRAGPGPREVARRGEGDAPVLRLRQRREE
ncbi:unnamed protein product, partial [Prorocentrum cordatum]